MKNHNIPINMSNTMAYKGSFNVRVSPELYRQAVTYAAAHQMALNSFVESAMRRSLGLQG